MSSSRILKLFNEIDPRRIVIIKPSALGDVVQTLPLLPVLKRRFPQAKIDWVIRSELANLLEDQPDLDQVLLYHRKGTISQNLGLLRQLWRNRYDLTLDLQGLLRTGVMTAATRAGLRVGLETAREYSHLTCHGLLPETGTEVPAHARYWKVAEYLGVTEAPEPIRLGFSSRDQQIAQELKTPLSRPYFVIHPGAKWITKRWPIVSFSEVAIRACRQYGLDLIVVGTGGERNDAEMLCRAVRDESPGQAVLNLAGKTSLKQLALILQEAELTLTNDSGPMHLSAGMGTPVVGIFTCTSTERSGPSGEQHRLIQAKVPCAASYRKQCPFTGAGHMKCLSAVSIHQVWTTFQKAMEQNQLGQRVA